MTEIAYSVSMLDGNTVTGVASKLFVTDESTLFTISANHAPLVGTLSEGKVVVFPIKGEPQEFTFADAFLNCQNNHVTLTAL